MEYLILGLLMFKPMTIYDLNQSLKQGLSLIYAASYGSLQNGVKKLLKAQHVTFEEVVEKGRNKKIYSINEDGMKAFKEWMFIVPENKLEVGILSRVFFLGLIKDKTARIALLEGLLEAAEREYQAIHAYETQLKNTIMPEAFTFEANYQIRTLNYGVGSHAFAVKWLQDLLEDVKNDKL